MIRVYIAAPFELQADAADAGRACVDAGMLVTARWVESTNQDVSDEWARKDLADVARADVLLALNPSEWARRGGGGRHVELGFAVAFWKPVVLLGVRSNIFHHLPTVHVVDTLDDAIATVRRVVDR